MIRDGARPSRMARPGIGLVLALLAIGGTALTDALAHPRGQAPGAPDITAGGPRASAPPTVPGWRAVVSADGSTAYDVPSRWEVSHRDADVPVGDGSWRLDLSMPARFGPDACSGGFRAQSGVGDAEGHDARRVATDTARRVAGAVYGRAVPVALSQPTSVPVGAVTGTLVEAQATGHPSVDQAGCGGACCGRSGLVDVVAVADPDHDASVVVVAYADQGFPGATTPSELDRLVTSLRTLTSTAH